MLSFQNPQLRRPIRQRQTEPVYIRMTRKDQFLYSRNLPAATRGSYLCHLYPFRAYLCERAPVCVKNGLFTRHALPPLNNDVHKLGI